MSTDRRTFLKQAAATVAVGAVGGCASTGGAAAERALDAKLLAALGESVLPEALGAGGRERTVRAFRDWIAGYEPVSEEMHGYGSTEIRYTPADPAPGWGAELSALDLLAQRKFGKGFAALELVQRRDLLRAQLSRTRVDRLPSSPLSAPHVAIALLSHWAASSEATDLAYGARIGRRSCRVLADSPRRPLPLASGGLG